MEVQKDIAFFIEQQFPGIYREDGQELVQLARDYYKWLEITTNQSNYVSRRFFEYKDVDTTIKELLIFYQKKYLADLELKPTIVSFLVKNILDLYRRKGTPGGIELFFSIFYKEYDIDVIYPAKRMLKISNSTWKQGVYLQMFPNDNFFLSKTDVEYSYADLISRNITGSASGAKAAVSKINFIILNGIKTPIIYIDEVQGNFDKYDDIITNINGEVISFGKVNGSLNGIDVDLTYKGTTGNEIGDKYIAKSSRGSGGDVIVTETQDKITGQIDYELDNGGYGYTIDNTRLLVSNQTLILDNEDLTFTEYERIQDTAGTQGYVVGQSPQAVGIYITSASPAKFNGVETITTLDRVDAQGNPDNVTLTFDAFSDRNDSSPGPLYPDTGLATDVKVRSLTNISTASVITDQVLPFVATNINAADYEATAPMSGSASPVNLTTPLNQAFDIQALQIGKITGFDNINPGTDYTNDVFARAKDDVFFNFDRRNQIIRFPLPGDAGVFSIGEIITEKNTSIQGEVRAINTEQGWVSVTPFDYYGFSGTNNIIRGNGDEVTVVGIQVDYNSPRIGDNANINTTTEFATGRISKVAVENSGFGYVDGDDVEIVDENNNIQAIGTLSANTQGVTGGYWADFSSHLNGYIPSEANNQILEYFTSGQRVQDSDFYQEYSYQIKSTLDKSQYEKLLKQNVHLAGSKMFGDFIYKVEIPFNTKTRFMRMFNDDGSGSPLDQANVVNLEASVTNFTVDSTYITADHVNNGGWTGSNTLDLNSLGVSDTNGNYPSTTTITVS